MRDDFSNCKSKHIIMENNKVIVHTEKNKSMDLHKEFNVPIFMYVYISRYV